MSVEWHPKSHFAECAEALGITTREIFSAIPLERGATVLYTPGITEDNFDVTAYLAVLTRDDDGILRLSGEPVEVPEFLTKLAAGIGPAITRTEEDDDDGNG